MKKTNQILKVMKIQRGKLKNIYIFLIYIFICMCGFGDRVTYSEKHLNTTNEKILEFDCFRISYGGITALSN